ncbi:MAG TPA: GNAT family N-acetyltransferase [Pirellulales bacterium]|jgi:CelD/BcsL family acetyltransferase involved in cellulose biosynthesis|nr:GNAT family N-acetyltransferase [Pirellulales bacterium]
MGALMVNTEQTLHVQLIDSLPDLEQLADAWNALAPENPFLTYSWAVAWWHHYQQQSGELFTLTVRDSAGRLIGVAPWHRQISAAKGRVVHFVGSGEVCADYLSLVTRPEDRSAVAVAIADWLAGPGAGKWDVLNMSGVDQADEAMARLHEEMAARGHATHESVRWQGWRTELPDNWDAFLAGLPKSRRTGVRNQIKKLVDTGRVQLRRAETAADVSRAFEILVDLHQKRRGVLQQPGCFASTSFTTFHRELATRFLESGKLRLSWLELDDVPIAIEYSFTGGDTVYYYQGGFDPGVSQLGPGWLMSALSLRAAIAEGYRYFDFLRGDEPYKASWNATPRPLVERRVVGRRPAARVRHAAWQTGNAVRRWAAERWPSAAARGSAALGSAATTGRTVSTLLVSVGCSGLGAWLCTSSVLPLARHLAVRRRT